MIAQAVLEQRVALLEASWTAGSLPSMTTVEMAAAVGITLDDWQREVLSSTAREIIMLASRQSGKSMTAALLALHRTAYSPGSLVLVVSPTERQSKLLLRTFKMFNRALPNAPAMTIENQLSLEFANGSAIFALPGSESTIRGFAAVDLLIIDEGARVPDELYYSTRPMLAVSGGRLVALSTPFGKRGWFHDEWTNGGPSWHRAKVRAAECPRIDPVWLEQERERIGSWWFDQEYDVAFRDTDDQLYSTDLVESALSSDVEPLDLPVMWSAA